MDICCLTLWVFSELYLKENKFDTVALNEMFLNKKLNFQITGYDTIRNNRSTGQKGGVAFLVKHGLVINKEYRNSDFSIITSNEALAINLDLSDNQNLTLATIYCPNGNPNRSLFGAINNLSDNVMFVGDFNSKLESFSCAKKNASGPMLQNIQKQLKVVHYRKVCHIGQIKREAPTHLPENQYNWKTNSGMNVKVGDIIQYYAYKILDVLDRPRWLISVNKWFQIY